MFIFLHFAAESKRYNKRSSVVEKLSFIMLIVAAIKSSHKKTDVLVSKQILVALMKLWGYREAYGFSSQTTEMKGTGDLPVNWTYAESCLRKGIVG